MATSEQPTLHLLGIPVHVPPSGILGVGLLAYLWAPSFAGTTTVSTWVLALSFAVLLSLATLVHEFAHALSARALGFPVTGVVLQLLGGVTRYERTRTAPLAEAAVSAAGPAATFVVAGASYAAAQALPPDSVAGILAGAMAWANLVIGIYNALPGLPLDGGSVVRSLIWAATGSERTGTQVAGWMGRGLAVLTLLIPLILAAVWGVRPDLLLVVLAGLLAAMLWSGATAQMRGTDIRARAENLSAGALARRAIPVPRELPLSEALRRASAAGAGALVVVDHLGTPVAIGQQDAIEAVPEQRRPWVTVSAVSRPLDAASTIQRSLVGTALLAEVAQRGREELLVLDEQGMVYGVLVTGDLTSALGA